MSTTYSAVSAGLENAVNIYVNQTSTAIITAITPIVGIGVTIWIINYGLAVTRGQAQAPVMDFTWKATKISMILGLGLSVGAYQSQIIPVVNDVFLSLSKIVSLQGSSNCNFSASQVFQMIDCNVSNQMRFPKALSNSIGGVFGSLGIGSTFLLVVLWVLLSMGITIFYIVLGVEVLYCRLALQLLLGIGPIFICALAFEPTKKFFDGWLSKIGYLCIFSMLIFAFLGMSISIVDSILMQAAPTILNGSGTDLVDALQGQQMDPFDFVLQVFTLFLILAWIGTRISGIASTLSNSSASGGSVGAFIGGMATRTILGKIGNGRRKTPEAPGGDGGGGKGGSIANAGPASQSRSEWMGQNLRRIATRGRAMIRDRS